MDRAHNINPEILTWARESARLSLAEAETLAADIQDAAVFAEPASAE